MVTLRASHWSRGDEGGGRRCRRREGGLARAASFGTLRIDCGLDPAWSIPNCRRRGRVACAVSEHEFGGQANGKNGKGQEDRQRDIVRAGGDRPRQAPEKRASCPELNASLSDNFWQIPLSLRAEAVQVRRKE